MDTRFRGYDTHLVISIIYENSLAELKKVSWYDTYLRLAYVIFVADVNSI
ncbi:MAG: hypothetical protein K8I03_05390 [Ignavibacteria bacterium]|nr:hypothetical protein [Ignavibacteria bacterium]